jgi:hypothetical protein
MLKYYFFLALSIAFLQVNAQKRDSISKPADTGKIKIPFKIKLNNSVKEIGGLFKDTTALQNARKAVLRSAILPGWGQTRNKQWWKVPLIYGGFVGIGLVYNFNNVEYKVALKESQFRKEKPGSTTALFPQYQGIPDQQIFQINNFYRRNRDLSLYFGILFYGIQLADAYTSARLATFDVSDNLSIKLKPSIYIPAFAQAGSLSPVPMLTLSIKLKQ